MLQNQVVFLLTFTTSNKKIVYSRRRIYQYNHDFKEHGYTYNMETKRSCQLTASLCLLVNL